MCTILVLNECVDGYPLIVAANRDESYARKSSPPVQKMHAGHRFIRPWDESKQGTWIGVGQDGWFAAITNQDDGKHTVHEKSRGHVVRDCLHARNHHDAAVVMSHVDPREYNPFNVVVGRPGAMLLCRVIEQQEVEFTPMPQGLTVVTNDCWGEQYAEKSDWAARLASSLIDDPPIDPKLVPQRLLVTLASHHSARRAKDDPFQALCVHAEEFAWGTVSTSIITVSKEGIVEYWYSEGHPCQSTSLTLVGRLQPTGEVQ